VYYSHHFKHFKAKNVIGLHFERDEKGLSARPSVSCYLKVCDPIDSLIPPPFFSIKIEILVSA
jgi:hypothetical protein